MEYPKHIFIITVILAILLGICLSGVGWIGFTGFLLLLLATLPVYWLEIYWERKARRRAVEAGKLAIFSYKEWNLEFFIYVQVLLMVALMLPDLLLGMEDLTFFQNFLGLIFSTGLVASKWVKGWPFRQVVTISDKNVKIYNYGYMKNIDWASITAVVIGKGNTQIKLTTKNSHTIIERPFAPDERNRLFEKIQQLARKKGIPVFYPKTTDSSEIKSSKFFKTTPKLLLFILLLMLDIFFVIDLITTLI